MAAGEYTSVASQSEAAEREIDKERREIIANPVAETDELAQMYVEKGLDPDLAREVARQIHADVDNAVTVHAREELGVDPHDLASPMTGGGVVVPGVRRRRARSRCCRTSWVPARCCRGWW